MRPIGDAMEPVVIFAQRWWKSHVAGNCSESAFASQAVLHTFTMAARSAFTWSADSADALVAGWMRDMYRTSSATQLPMPVWKSDFRRPTQLRLLDA